MTGARRQYARLPPADDALRAAEGIFGMDYRQFVRRLGWPLCAGLLALHLRPALALDLSTTVRGEDVHITLNNALTVGAAVRMQDRSSNLIGKSAINPNVCAPPYQSCQGLFRDQTYYASYYVAQPGAPSRNSDRGDLNYAKYDLIQAPVKLTSDLTVQWQQWSLFVRMLGFYDAVNDHFTEYNPNQLTPQNRAASGRADPTFPGGRVYGPGGVTHERRRDSELLRQSGADIQFLDAVLSTTFPLGDRDLNIKVGRQTLNWGESTLLLINSLSQATPVNTNNVFRVGAQTEEFFRPVNMVSASSRLLGQVTVAAYYKLEWQPLEIPTPGTFFSDLNLGTHNAVRYLNDHPGQLADDPYCQGYLVDNPLSNASNTCNTVGRLRDFTPRSSGQFGINLGYNFENLGDGVQVNAYFQRYHSQLPYVSFFATTPSCARRQGNALGIDATDVASLLLASPDLPITHLLTGDPQNAKSNILLFNQARFAFDYPEGINLFGLSFNTTLGDYALQGEVAYRPNKPMQIDGVDLAFAAMGPTLSDCHNPAAGCSGSALGGLGSDAQGKQVYYGDSDFIPAPGVKAYNDTFAVATLGALPGAARAFPNFVIPYRGGVVGENAPCFAEGDPRHLPYNHRNPCYIRGFERFRDFNFDFSLSRVLGATDNWIGADQVIMVYEFGAEWVPDMPALDRLPLQGPGAGRYGPTAGADGSGADGSRMACSTNPACSIGPDGLRFNIHQQPRDTFPTPFSAGQRFIGIAKYESVLPGISLQPSVVLKHDISGIAPGPAGNFVRGRKEADLMLETRYKSALSFTLGYTWYWGAGALNTLSDRDYAQFFARYQF